MKNIDVIETSTGLVQLTLDNIVRIQIKQDAEISIDEANELLEALGKVSKDKHLLLIDATECHALTMQAKVEILKARNVKALAIVTSSWVAKTTTENLLKTNYPICPTKIFMIEDEAVEWMKLQM